MATAIGFGVALILWVTLLVFFRHYRIWILFYVTGAVGLAFLLIVFGTKLLPIEFWLETAVAYSAHELSQLFGIPTQVYAAAPGNILVWVVFQEPGWTVVRVDLECSGLLELSVLAGLLMFYPAWTFGRRIWMTLAGWVATFAANVVRVVSIILILHNTGKRSIFIAHTIAGRLIFVVLVGIIYWLIFTRGTLRILGKTLSERMRS